LIATMLIAQVIWHARVAMGHATRAKTRATALSTVENHQRQPAMTMSTTTAMAPSIAMTVIAQVIRYAQTAVLALRVCVMGNATPRKMVRPAQTARESFRLHLLAGEGTAQATSSEPT
jgi:hypothetical protein